MGIHGRTDGRKHAPPHARVEWELTGFMRDEGRGMRRGRGELCHMETLIINVFSSPIWRFGCALMEGESAITVRI